jgi:D-3-phosphoglycerate dehydrogenase
MNYSKSHGTMSNGLTAKDYYIIDFDSTFTQVEALDELVKISRGEESEINTVLGKIKEITDLAMEGKLSFQESLEKRIQMLKAHKNHLNPLIQVLKKRISPSFARNKAFFKNNADRVFIVSGGFREFILPVIRPYNIPERNVFANTFRLDKQGWIIGFDKSNPLSKEGGKVLLLKEWNLQGDLYGIGDGHSDYQLKESGLIKKFFAFTENISRESIVQKADFIVPSFDEFLYINQLPRAISYPKNRILSLFVGSFTDSEINIFKKDGLSVRIKSIFEEKYWKDVGLLVLGEGIHIPDEILEKAVKLKVIGLQNPNQNRLNEELCTRRGIVVFKGSGKGEKKGKGTMERILVRMIDFINKGSTLGSSNFPNIHLPPSKSAHRLLHIHHNIPGIIAQINLVMARHHLNIEAQILKTNPDLGYVITDVNSKYDQAVLSDLKKIDQTIKFRILY